MTKFCLLTAFLFVKTLIGFVNPLITADSTLIKPPNSSVSIVGGIMGAGFELSYLILPSHHLW